MTGKRVLDHAAFLVSLLVFAVYLPALKNGFVNWDDPMWVVGNPHIRSLDREFIVWALTDIKAAGNWHPITWLSLGLDHAIWGMDPFGFHLTGIFLHAVNSGLVVWLAQTLLTRAGSFQAVTFLNGRTVPIAAVTAGLLFGLHPANVEPASWIADRRDLLCALFSLLTLVSYVRHAAAQPGGQAGTVLTGNYFAALIFFALALGSKATAIMLPFVLFLLDWYPLGRMSYGKHMLRVVFEKVPFLLLGLGTVLAAYLALQDIGVLALQDVSPLMMRLGVASRSLVLSLRNLAAPLFLRPVYPYPEGASFAVVPSLLWICVASSITAVAFAAARKQSAWLAAWGFYVITMLPVTGIVRLGGHAMADRYLYLPGLGPLLLAGIGAAWLWDRAGGMSARRGAARVALAAVAGIVLFSLAVMTVRQIGVWRNSITYWSHVVAKEPSAMPLAYYLRGLAYTEQGEYALAEQDFTSAIFLDPGYAAAYMSRGAALGALGRFSEAVEDLDLALRLKPESVQAYLNRGLAYEGMGRHDRAIEDYTRAIEADPEFARGYVDRGNLYVKTGRPESADIDFQKACDLGNDEGCLAVRKPRR
jgi:Flp pilus assembly protein TadD